MDWYFYPLMYGLLMFVVAIPVMYFFTNEIKWKFAIGMAIGTVIGNLIGMILKGF